MNISTPIIFKGTDTKTYPYLFKLLLLYNWLLLTSSSNIIIVLLLLLPILAYGLFNLLLFQDSWENFHHFLSLFLILEALILSLKSTFFIIYTLVYNPKKSHCVFTVNKGSLISNELQFNESIIESNIKLFQIRKSLFICKLSKPTEIPLVIIKKSNNKVVEYFKSISRFKKLF